MNEERQGTVFDKRNIYVVIPQEYNSMKAVVIILNNSIGDTYKNFEILCCFISFQQICKIKRINNLANLHLHSTNTFWPINIYKCVCPINIIRHMFEPLTWCYKDVVFQIVLAEIITMYVFYCCGWGRWCVSRRQRHLQLFCYLVLLWYVWNDIYDNTIIMITSFLENYIYFTYNWNVVLGNVSFYGTIVTLR